MWESRRRIRDLPPRPTTLPRTDASRARNRPSWYAVATVIALLRFLFDLVLAFVAPRAALIAENLLLRQQLIVVRGQIRFHRGFAGSHRHVDRVSRLRS